MDRFDEYLSLYKERYGDFGPSMSSSYEKHPYDSGCGCWECQLVELREYKKSSTVPIGVPERPL